MLPSTGLPQFPHPSSLRFARVSRPTSSNPKLKYPPAKVANKPDPQSSQAIASSDKHTRGILSHCRHIAIQHNPSHPNPYIKREGTPPIDLTPQNPIRILLREHPTTPTPKNIHLPPRRSPATLAPHKPLLPLPMTILARPAFFVP